MPLGTKNQENDRVIIPVRREGNTMTDQGLVDNRIFNGGNRIHAVQDESGLWVLRYDSGSVPPALRQQFTSFSQLLKFLRSYFDKRNIDIKEIIS
jgi:hypothetical protein